MIVGLKQLCCKVGYAVLSLWLAFHVFAVFISPAAMPPASPLLEDGYRLALPYNEALFLNHGYHYFAPDPGASTLIAWEIPRDGDAPAVGRFPDVTIRPRLMYHRYFMLAENVWAFDDETQQDMLKAYARHFADRFGSDRISLSRISHAPSSMMRLQAGGKLDDPETFEKDVLGDFDLSAKLEEPNPSVAKNF
ncbi:MAG: hypothetical protein WKF77_12205 [Planctomycetaceae bacterium]